MIFIVYDLMVLRFIGVMFLYFKFLSFYDRLKCSRVFMFCVFHGFMVILLNNYNILIKYLYLSVIKLLYYLFIVGCNFIINAAIFKKLLFLFN